MRISALREAVFVGGVACVFVSSTTAEPLDPPDGPVEPTGATQILEIPFTIDEPGSYRLVRDATAPAGAEGITIEADNVTLDLGGHSLTGEGLNGVLLSGERSNVTIRDGRIADWTAAGIWDGKSVDTGVVIEDVTITGAGFGILLDASQATVRDVVVRDTSSGIFLGDDSRLADSRVINTIIEGIIVGDESKVAGCIVTGSDANGVFAGQSCVIENTIARDNGEAGVVAGAGASVRGCISESNGGDSAEARADSPIDPRAGELIRPDSDSSAMPAREENELIGAPDAGGEGVDAGPDGFRLGADSFIIDSVARQNAGDGVSADEGSHIERCVANLNAGNGVRIDRRTTVFRCTTTDNEGDGIFVAGDDNRVDSNTIASNDGDGIFLNDGANRVVRNDLSVNSIIEKTLGENNLPPDDSGKFIFDNPWMNFVDFLD